MRIPRPAPSAEEAAAWADVLVRYRLLHAAVPAPNGQWLVQHHPDGLVTVLCGSAALLGLVAELQQRARIR
ncbi:hypothetical protein LIU39_00310 [Streptomyces sp. SF28]|nr:hypothetical protein [Streptomyces pinistramenti]